MTNFPNGVSSFGVPVLPQASGGALTGNVWFVKSGGGTNGSGSGSDPSLPLTTLQAAHDAATASNGDVIYLMPGHAETVSSAAAITMSKAGITVVGLGSGAQRPTFTFGTVTGASILISGANFKCSNIVGVAALDGLTKPFNISGVNCVLDLEWQDGSSAIEAATVVLTTAAADNLRLTLKHIGFSAGDAGVSLVQLVGCNAGVINLDAFGKFSTAAVEFVTTLSTGIEVYGYIYNSSDTTGVKLVVDTVTSSTWFASVYAGAAGASFSGGSGAAMASDDVSSVAAQLTVATTDAATNTNARDVVGNKSDAAVTTVGTVASIVAYAKGLLNQIGALVNTGGTATLGGIIGDLANISLATRLSGSIRVAKVALANTDMTGTTTRFTITNGPVLVRHLGMLVTTAIPAGANTLKIQFTPTGGAATDLCGATDTASGGAQQLYIVDGTKATGLVKTTDVGILAAGQVEHMPIILGSGVITTVFSAGPPASGAAQLFMEWEPMNTTSAVA